MLRKVTSLLTLCTMLVLGVTSAMAYSYNVANGTYTAISGGTQHATGSAVTGFLGTVSLPFTFTFDGVAYTSVNVHGNGYITFGTASSVTSVLTNPIASSGAVAAWCRSLAGTASGEIRTDVLGSAGSRVFVAQWSNLTRNPVNASSDVYNFQIRLNEGSQRVDIVYGAMNVTAAVGAQIGMRGTTQGLMALQSSYYSAPWTNPRVLFSAPTPFVESMALEGWAPSSGLTYSFRPTITGVTTNDAGIVAMVSPSGKVNANTNQTIQVRVRNFGANNLDSVIINWSVNGVARLATRYYPQPALTPGQEATVQLGTEQFTAFSFNTIVASTSMPNGVTDAIAGNNGATYYVAPRVSGVINVAQSTNPGVFPSYREALRHVQVSGISGNLEIRGFTGTYTEQLLILPIDNSFAGGTVSLTEAAGNDVVVQWTPTPSAVTVNYNSYEAARHVVDLVNGASNITIRNLTVRIPDGSNGGGTIGMGTSSFPVFSNSNILLENNTLTGPNNFLTATGSTWGVTCPAGTSNITVRGNTITRQRQGIILSSGSNSVIERNTVRDFTVTGIQATSATNLMINANTLVSSTASSNVTAIRATSTVSGMITNNTVVLNQQPTLNSGAVGVLVSNGSGTITLTNNMISVGAQLIVQGISATLNSGANGNIRMYHNSVNVVGTASALNSQAVRLASNIDFSTARYEIVNNIFHNFGTGTGSTAGHAIFIDETGAALNATTRNPFAALDFNNLMTTGINVGNYDGVEVPRVAGSNPLSTWRTTTGRDNNSVSLAVNFVGSDDLHLLAIQTPLYGASTLLSTVPTDIDGETRVRPYMGADEIKPTITIVQQPQSRYACLGENITLVCVANITPGSTTTYQWMKDGVELNGQTSAIITFGSVGYGAAGVYTCNVKATDGVNNIAVLSEPASLIIVRNTEITVQPMSQPVSEDGTVDLMVQAEAVGSPSSFVARYQWKKRFWNSNTRTYVDTNVRDNGRITGSTSNILTIRDITNTDTTDTYVCEVQGYCGTTLSKAARLFMPVASATLITQSTCTGGVIQIECAANPGNSAGLPIEFQWFRNGVALTDGGRVSGSNTKVLTVNDATGTDAADYQCKVTYVGTTAVVPTENIAIEIGTLPVVTQQPQGSTVCVGNDVTLSAAATGVNVSYQWFKGTTAIPRANGATFVVSNATEINAGTYSVQVSNACGNLTSQAAEVIVNPAVMITQQPANVNVGLGSEIRFSVVANGSGTLTYKWFKNGVEIAGATQATYTITRAETSDSGSYMAVVVGECGADSSDVAIAKVGTTGVTEDITFNGYGLSLVSPNPTSGTASFTFTVPATQAVRIVLTDMVGREVATLFNETAFGGEQRVVVDPASYNLTNGVYNVTIVTPGFVAAQQVIVNR
jgi:parallel beta-helix repeat protein